MRKIFLVAALFVSVFVSAQDLTILHLNDTHSHIEPQRNGSLAGRGGVIEQAAYIDSVRCVEGKGNVILLHAGDFSQGTSYFKVFNGDIEVEVANAMQYDALCLGNHEFDFGMEQHLNLTQKLNSQVLCANFTSIPTNKSIYRPYGIKKYGETDIAFIGIATPATATSVSPKTFHDSEGNTIYSFQPKNWQ